MDIENLASYRHFAKRGFQHLFHLAGDISGFGLDLGICVDMCIMGCEWHFAIYGHKFTFIEVIDNIKILNLELDMDLDCIHDDFDIYLHISEHLQATLVKRIEDKNTQHIYSGNSIFIGIHDFLINICIYFSDLTSNITSNMTSINNRSNTSNITTSSTFTSSMSSTT